MTKRKRKSTAPDSTESKRARQSSDGFPPVSSQPVSYGRVDPTYGQRSAIPGLDDEDYNGERSGGGEGGESDVEYMVDVEALRYLRSVRYVSPSPFPSAPEYRVLYGVLCVEYYI